jgi:glycosyltransferase involved in cell wall biosynthesis
MNIGGPARHVSLLSEGLNRRGYCHLLVTGRESEAEGNFRDLSSQVGVQIVDVECLGREISLFNDLLCIWHVARIIRKFRPDIVHTHTAKAGFVGRIATILVGVPCIAHTFHGHVLRGYFSTWKNLLFRFCETLLAGQTDLLIAVSHKVAEELAEEGVAPVNRFEVLPLGLHLKQFLLVQPHGKLRAELGLPDTAQLIGAVGRLVPIKDLECMLSALALMGADFPDLHLALVGDGELRKKLYCSAKEKGLGERVHFLGWRHDLSFIYGGLDLVVLSSRNEGTPVSLIEALAAGRPVVATNVGGVPEVLEKGQLGRLVPAGDPEPMSQAIREALYQPCAPSPAQRRALVEKYSPERLVDRMDNLYRQLLDCRGKLRVS